MIKVPYALLMIHNRIKRPFSQAAFLKKRKAPERINRAGALFSQLPCD
jgi:hypothetical protein